MSVFLLLVLSITDFFLFYSLSIPMSFFLFSLGSEAERILTAELGLNKDVDGIDDDFTKAYLFILSCRPALILALLTLLG